MMDHPWRNFTQGLIELEDIPTRRLCEESKVLINVFATLAIERLVPLNLRTEFDGWARSFYTLDMHVNAIQQCTRSKLPSPTDAAWLKTTQYVRNLFKKMSKVRAISYKEIDAVKWVRSSAAGYGYTSLKGDGDNYIKARKTAFTLAEALNHNRDYGRQELLDSTPEVAFIRT